MQIGIVGRKDIAGFEDINELWVFFLTQVALCCGKFRSSLHPIFLFAGKESDCIYH